VPDSVLDQNPTGFDADEFPTRASRKVFNVLQNKQIRLLVEPQQDPRIFVLHDDGSPEHGDKKKNDGIYSMKYKDTNRPGHYNFDISMKGIIPEIGYVERQEQHKTMVGIKEVDAGKTEAIIARTPDTNNYDINIVPADRFGNFYGPGIADKIQVKVDGDDIGPVEDKRENGTYVTQLKNVSPDQNPELTVSVAGKEVRRCKIKNCPLDKRYAVFVNIGRNEPQGSFGNLYNRDISYRFGFEYLLNARFSVEAEYGHEKFDAPKALDIDQVSVDAKYYVVVGTFQLGVRGGLGVYNADPGDTHLGINAGATAEYRFTPSWSLDINSNFHNVFTSGTDIQYMTLQGGVRYRF
jgi:hypothetical protein